MKLHMHPVSQHARRVLMLCREIGQEIEAVPVALDKGEHKSDAFLKLNAAGQVPVLQDGEFTLAESHAIMRYIAELSGNDRVYPADARQRAMVDMWLDWNHTQLNPPVQTIALQMFMNGDNADREVLATAHGQAGAALARLEDGLDSGSALGGSPTLADFSIASTLALYEMVGGDLSGYSAVVKWLDRIKAMACFRDTAPPAP